MKFRFSAIALCVILCSTLAKNACFGQTDQLTPLVFKLLNKMNSKTDTVDFVFEWIAQNIAYDVQLSKSSYTDESSEEILNFVISNKKGVCQHYAELFSAICNALGYESYSIAGFTKTHNQVDSVPHAWNAVKLKSGWAMYDATWAAGYLKDGKFHFDFGERWQKVPPVEFLETHVPFDPLWRLSESHSAKGDVFTDSIRFYNSLPELEKLQNSIARIKKYELTNPLIEKQLRSMESYYNYLLHEKAVNILTHAIDSFYLYMDSKHNYFRNPEISDGGLTHLLDSVYTDVKKSKFLLNLVSFNDDENQLILRKNLKTTERLANDIHRESRFIESAFSR